jgi:hypothetical protein
MKDRPHEEDAHTWSSPPEAFPLTDPLLHRRPASSSRGASSCWLLVPDGSWGLPKMPSSDAACVVVEQRLIWTGAPLFPRYAQRDNSKQAIESREETEEINSW